MDTLTSQAPGLRRLYSERLLLADADMDNCNHLAQALNQMGYSPEIARNGRQALAFLQAQPYDVLLLNLHMPDVDGIELLSHIRQLAPDMVIIALTRLASLDTAIAAVKFRVSDYLVQSEDVSQVCNAISEALNQRAKQIQERILLRALGEMMERMPRMNDPAASGDPEEKSDVIHIPPVQLNLRERTAVVYENPNLVCRLTNNEVDLLANLMRHADEVVQVSELAEVVLGQNVSQTTAYSSVSHHVHRLRQKIEVLPGKPRILRTVRGRGYMFVSTAGAGR
jgi:DNA-binding response OmpR family regulator